MKHGRATRRYRCPICKEYIAFGKHTCRPQKVKCSYCHKLYKNPGILVPRSAYCSDECYQKAGEPQ